MKWINDEDISTLLKLDKYLLCYESTYGSYCCQSEVMIGFTVDRWMETSKRQCKDKAIYKFSPVNTSRLSIFWVSNSSKCRWREVPMPQAPSSVGRNLFGRLPPAKLISWISTWIYIFSISVVGLIACFIHCQWSYCSYVFCYLHRKFRRQISVVHLHTFVQSQKYCSNIRLFFNVAVLALSNWMSIGSQPFDFYQHTWKEKEYLQFDSSHIKIPFPNKLDKSLGYLNNGTSRDSNLFKWIEQNFII